MADVFNQVYSPVGGSVLVSALVAALPPILLAVFLAVLRIAPWESAIAAAATAFVLAWLVWGMPLRLAMAAMTQGMAFGLWPISWIVLSAVFFYNLSVESGDFDVIRRSLARATGDRRIQVVLVAFCFGALIEGIAGFGAPVAITASMLAGLGFAPITAATLALIANTTPVAFGSLGIPITTLGGLLAPILGHDVQATTRALSAMAGRQLALFSIIIPAYLVVLFAGWKKMVEVLPAVFVAGGSFALSQFVVSNYVGPELTASLSALFSLASMILLLKVWRPREEFVDVGAVGPAHRRRAAARPPARVARAYATYGILIAVVLVGQIGNFAGLSSLRPPLNVTALLRCGQVRLPPVPSPGSVKTPPPPRRRSVSRSGNSTGPEPTASKTGRPTALVRREPPVVAASSPYPLTYRLDFLAAAGKSRR